MGNGRSRPSSKRIDRVTPPEELPDEHLMFRDMDDLTREYTWEETTNGAEFFA